MARDLVLSSGFLAFARHVGVLQAIEQADVEVTGICGTSSGALVGSLWASGMPASQIAEHLSAQIPLSMMSPHLKVWRGLFTMNRVLEQLRVWLPPRIEDLPIPFGAGVLGLDGEPIVLRSGSLPEAVAASCAIPYVFAPVEVDGVRYRDGGVVDRTGLTGWRAARGQRPTVLHLVDRTGGAVTDLGSIPADVVCVRTPRSGAQFWDLGDFSAQVAEARDCAQKLL